MTRKKLLAPVLVLALLIAVPFMRDGICKSSEYEVISVKFFEAGDNPPELAQRSFASSFARNPIRYIWTQIDVKNLLYNVRQQNHSISWQYYTSDGNLWGEVKGDFPIPPDWATAYHQNALGWSNAGNWPAGKFTVHVLIDGQKVAQGEFSVYEDTPGATTSSVQDLLYDAASKGDIAAIKDAISKGADVNKGSMLGLLALETAARNGHIEAVKTLLDNGADINAQDVLFGFTALMSAASVENIDMMKLLIEKGANLNIKSRVGDFTAIIYAADSGKTQAVKLLLDSGADANSKSTEGVTALIFATQKGRKETVQALLDNGADISIKDNKSRTALAWATFEKQAEVEKLLRQAQAVKLGDAWKGKWTGPEGYLYTFNMKINLDKDNNAKGEITWTMEISPVTGDQSKINSTGVELVKGTYDPNTRVLYMEGYEKKDPKGIVGLDKYRLNVSLDGKTLSGKTYNNGPWTGKFYGSRAGILDMFKK